MHAKMSANYERRCGKGFSQKVQWVLKVGDNSIFFLALFLSTDQNRNYAMSLEDVKPLVTQNFISSSWRELYWKKFFFLSFESKRFGISKTIVTKNMWIERKKLFQREKQNLKEIKIEISKSQLFSKKKWKNWKFWQKFCNTSISGVFFFLILGAIW